MAVKKPPLMRMYRAMRAHFGHRGWWPGETTLEICVGAILTQNTNWKNVEKALADLEANGAMTMRRLHAIPRDDLAALIRPAGYFNVKAVRLKNFISHVWEHSRADIDGFLDRAADRLREDLLSVNGIGPETADSIVLYAAGQASFVIDAYTHRILVRHGLIARRSGYAAQKALFESNLRRDVELWKDYHAQLVAVGKYFCRSRARCEGCPLERFAHDADAELRGGQTRPQ